MVEFLKVLVLGIVEGVTEFLPISSTGHLILVHQFFSLSPENFSNAFDVIIQFGAILSVVTIYFKELNPFSKEKNAEQKKSAVSLWKKVIIGVMPAIVLGLLFDDLIDKYLFNPISVAVMLVFWGIGIIILEKKSKSVFQFNTVHDISCKTAFMIGLFQCLAMIPGTSRSAATIIGAMILGCSRTTAAEFSFFLAIPTMLGATMLKILKVGLHFDLFQWFLVLFGSVISYIVAILVIQKLMSYIKKHDFQFFGYYRIVLGILVLIFSFFHQI